MTPYLKILEKISKPHWFEIIRLIKCSPGLSVGELAEKMNMSYMGVKKHCLAMQKLGYLDTWRRPKEVGRPEKTYRVTDKLAPLFPQIGNEVSLAILDAATQLEVNAAEKLLFAFFREQTESLAAAVSGDTVSEKAEALALARAKMGYFSSFEESAEEGLVIDEHHNPLQPLFDRYPTLAKMEAQMFERLLGAAVKRSYSKVSGLTHYRFEITPL
ncbi:MAG: winged helix-turn-helix transcriptional regulator [Verrucomicrobiota bacterium]